ncbi:hypothetical protein DK872_26885 [Kosakonia sp. MH5]|nr:hypothetical protein [Kosakonia sp. MH5]NCF08870.1 hypothetical protein [Kosakonia sp. MH5]
MTKYPWLAALLSSTRTTGFRSSVDRQRLSIKVSDDLMLSKTGFTHSDLLRWQIEYVGRSLKVNGSF